MGIEISIRTANAKQASAELRNLIMGLQIGNNAIAAEGDRQLDEIQGVHLGVHARSVSKPKEEGDQGNEKPHGNTFLTQEEAEVVESPPVLEPEQGTGKIKGKGKATKAPAKKPEAPAAGEMPDNEDPTLDNCRLWIKCVCAKAQENSDATSEKEREETGHDQAARIIGKFSKEFRISTVAAEDYGKFIATCKEYMVGGEGKAKGGKKNSVADMM